MRCTCLVVVGAVALAPARGGAAPRPRGKVVRVERVRQGVTVPRVCDIRGDRTGTCVGLAPRVGDVVTVLDEASVLAEVRVVETTPFAVAAASCISLGYIKTEIVRGDLGADRLRTIGIVDPLIHPTRARNLPRERFPPTPSTLATDAVAIAVDRDGDGEADLVVTQSACDGASAANGACLDEYTLVGTRMVRVHQTNLSSCGF